jgi:hypothetical protein
VYLTHITTRMFAHFLQLSVVHYIRKSLIAAWLGNLVGALLVAVPALYFYLHEEDDRGIQGVEEGEGLNETSSPAQSVRVDDEKKRSS